MGGASWGLMVTYGSRATAAPGFLEFSRFFALGRPSLRTITLGALVGLGIKFPADGVRALTERLFPTPEVTLAAQAELLRHETPAQMLALVLVIGVLAPCVEELFYRGGIYRLLVQSRGVITASAFTLVAFTLSHAAARDWPALLIVAFVLTLLRVRSGTLWPALVAHIAFNSATLLALFTGRSEVLDPFQVGPWGVIAGVVLSVGLLARLRAESASGRRHA
jgi:membrane protease YdiL (CAAX protease family)